MQLADQEAKKLNHDRIGTEHILLGMLQESYCHAVQILKKVRDGFCEEVKHKIGLLIQPGPDMVTMGRLPKTLRAKTAIEFAAQEVITEGDNFIGTEHLLIGLLQVQEGVAAFVLNQCGLTLEIGRTLLQQLRTSSHSVEVYDPNSVEIMEVLVFKLPMPLSASREKGFWENIEKVLQQRGVSVSEIHIYTTPLKAWLLPTSTEKK